MCTRPRPRSRGRCAKASSTSANRPRPARHRRRPRQRTRCPTEHAACGIGYRVPLSRPTRVKPEQLAACVSCGARRLTSPHPAAMGPPFSRPIVGEVIGFALQWDGQEQASSGSRATPCSTTSCARSPTACRSAPPSCIWRGASRSQVRCATPGDTSHSTIEAPFAVDVRTRSAVRRTWPRPYPGHRSSPSDSSAFSRSK
jgi:hypothetical protein